MLCCQHVSQVNIVVYPEESLKSNLKNMEGDEKEKKPCSLPLKVYPISQSSGWIFEARRANLDDT